MRTVPQTQPGVWPEIGADRFALGVRRDSPDGCRIAIVGLADDLGVRLNGGRVGARRGPAAFRAALARFGCGHDALTGHALETGVFDAGDVVPAEGDDAAALARTHERVTEALEAIHGMGLVPVCIGGGHDLTFASVRAAAQRAGGALGGVNLDAHLDVREEAGSGMPFRALIEGGFVDAARFTVLGAGRFTNSAAHCAYLRGRGGRIVTVDEVMSGGDWAGSALARAGERAFVTIDLDAIDGSCAPGVSAVNPCGVGVGFACEVARRAGASGSVRHFDLMELSPAHDEPAWVEGSGVPGRTARLAALVFMHFVAGFGERGGS